MDQMSSTDPQRCLGCGMDGGRHLVTCEFYIPAVARNQLDKEQMVDTGATEPSELTRQVGGDHYKQFDKYQPWEVFGKWFTAEELRGFMKGTVASYLARQKNGHEDIEKAYHTLGLYLEIAKVNGKVID